jgi:hypothetical protein
MDEDESTWPDYLPSDWVDEPTTPIDPLSVLVWGVLAAMVVIAAVLYVRV